ncbi:protein seele [Bacillus rossius redtenbacheri]|uniref:protein seele n=1 Tax=Bacillus rossius redtenbacheri TaxID=93214 RepID=UPI002FDD060F
MNVLYFLLFVFVSVSADQSKQLRCLVCRHVVDEIDNIIQKVDPKKKVSVGGYRLDSNGNQKQKSVPFARSEMHLTEVMETVCDKMDDYVRGTYKTSGELTVLRLITEDGKMNPLLSEVDLIQDSDLNKSLKFYCEGIVEEFEDNILRLFGKDAKNIDIKLCTDEAALCSQTEPDDDYTFEEKEEL